MFLQERKKWNFTSFVLLLISISTLTACSKIASDYGESNNENTFEKLYTVTWENWDGSILEVDANLKYGDIVEYNGPTPTKKSDSLYSYNFSGWNPMVTVVKKDTVYTAQYSKDELVKSLTINREKMYLNVGNKFKISILENVPNVTYIANNSNVVEHNGDGIFEGIGVGTASIYAQAPTGVISSNRCNVICVALDYPKNDIKIFNSVSNGHEMAILSEIDFSIGCNIYGTPFLLYEFKLNKTNSEKYDSFKIRWKLFLNNNLLVYSGTIFTEKCSPGDTLLCSGYLELYNDISPSQYSVALFDYE